MNRFAAPLALVSTLTVACSDDSSSTSSTTDAGRDVAVVADTAGQKNDGVPPADVSADPPSSSLADAVGRDPKSGQQVVSVMYYREKPLPFKEF